MIKVVCFAFLVSVASAQTTLFQDNFNTGTLSPAWTVSGTGSASAASGALWLGSVSPTSSVSVQTGSPTWVDYTLQFVAYASSNVFFPGVSGEVRVRNNPSAGTFLAVDIDYVAGTMGLSDNNGILLAPQPTTVSAPTIDTISIEVTGNAITVRVGGTIALTHSSSAIAAHTSGGIAFGTDIGEWQIDDVVITGQTVTTSYTQPFGPGSIQVDVAGSPGDYFFIAVSFDPANAGPGLGTGWWGGLHISVLDLQTQLGLGFPFTGFLDGAGAASWNAPGGVLGTGHPAIYAISHTFDPTTFFLTGKSSVAWIDPVTNPPGPPAWFAYSMVGTSFSAANRHSAAADVNNDGIPDLCNSAGIWLGDGSFGFTFSGIDPAGVEAEVAELTGDGLADLVVLDNVANGLQIYPGDGTGMFSSPPIQLPVVVEDRGDVRVTDLDNDGLMDLLCSTGATSSPGVVRFQNNGSGMFSQFGSTFESASTACESADLNGDMKPDLILSLVPASGGFAAEETRILWGDFVAPGMASHNLGLSDQLLVMPENGSRWLRAHDMNNDGHLDILWAGDNNQGVLINDGMANPSFSYSPISVAPYVCCGYDPMLSAADVDDDGDKDAVFIGENGGANYLVVAVNDGTATFTETWYIPLSGASPGHVFSADLDQDGDDDLVIGGNNVTLLHNQN